jgi:hypothetical protein
VCIYSPEGWLPLLYRMDVCIYRWSCQKTSRSLARISPASIHIAPVYDCLTLGLKVSYRFSFRASVTFLHSFILMLRGWGAVFACDVFSSWAQTHCGAGNWFRRRIKMKISRHNRQNETIDDVVTNSAQV